MARQPRKRKGSEPSDGFEPHVRTNPASMLKGTRFARTFVLARSFMGVRIVERLANVPSQLGVRDRYVSDAQLANYPVEVCSLQSALEELKTDALAEGATPEAIVLIGAVSPFTEEELNTMAEKLTKKAAPKKAAAEKKTPAPKATKATKAPKAEGGAPRAPANFKYKTLMTAKQAAEKYPRGWTARMVEIILSHKDTESARAELASDKEHNERRLDFGWAEKKGLIEKA